MRWTSVPRPAHSALGNEQDPFRRPDHLVKQRVEVVQGAGKGPLFEAATPNRQRQALQRKPRVGVESVRTREPFDPGVRIGKGPDGGRGLEGDGVEWNGHVRIV